MYTNVTAPVVPDALKHDPMPVAIRAVLVLLPDKLAPKVILAGAKPPV
jgi:hypothetical protein